MDGIFLKYLKRLVPPYNQIQLDILVFAALTTSQAALLILVLCS